MGQYFARDYRGPHFDVFGPAHLVLLAIVAVLGVRLFFWKPGRLGRRIFRWSTALLLLVNILGWHAWKILVGEWTIQEMLPLHLSSILSWMTPVMLLSKNRRLSVFCYFAGLPGALLAMLIPQLGIYDFPHFRVVSFFIVHTLIFISPIYMTRVEGMRPAWNEMWAVWGILAAYTVLIMGLNSLIGSNYLFVSTRTDAAEVPNFLWQWPWYVMMQGIYALILMNLLYLPFAIGNRMRMKSNFARTD